MKFSLALILCFFALPSFGQLKVINKDLIKPDSNLLYYSVQNHLAIVGLIELKEIKIVSSSNSEISIDNKEIIIRPRTKLGLDTLRFFKGKTVILSKVYKIDVLEDPISQLAFTSDTILFKNAIIANPILSVKLPNSIYSIKSVVYAFSCWIYRKNGQIFQFENDGGRLSNKIIASIQSLSPGDRLVFENIKIGFGPSYCPRTMMKSLNIAIR